MLRLGMPRPWRVAVVAAALGVLVAGCESASETASNASLAESSSSSSQTSVAGAAAPEPGVCKGCTPPLRYRGGPVLGTNGLTLVPIYWAPQGHTFPDGYVRLVNQYLDDVAAASGRGDNTYAVDTEYSQSGNAGTAAVKYDIRAGAPVMDTSAFPATADGCPVTAPSTACVSRDQIMAEIVAQLNQGNLPGDLAHLYLVFLPPDVATTDGKSSAGFCGFHSSFGLTNGGTVVWADEPYTPGCFGGQSPNGNQAADTEIDTLSHEISEAITDPLGAQPSWVDGSGNEIGDECNFNYGPPLGSADPANAQTTQYNQVLNGHFYYAQTMFSNASYQAQGQGHGCIQAGFTPGGAGPGTPAATTTAYRLAPAAGAPAQATVDLAETRLPADGSSTTRATITELDAGGEPVAGDHIHFLVQTGGETTAGCGTVSPADGVTDANGEMTTTYTASSADLACIVLGDDAESGTTDWATVYQGTAATSQPGITDASLPTSLTPGGAADTFTVTATNPSKDDIKDARFDVFLTGDGNDSSGLTAAEVHISYSDASTGGTMVPLQMSGETAKGGEIEGDAMPDTAADLPAGASDTVTFQVSLDAAAPASAVTGSPLHLEVDVDQFNPADGTTDNLDYVGPADIPVGS